MNKSSRKQMGESPTARGEIVKDLVCKMDVVKDGALTDNFNNRTYYFCSEECRDRFKAEPEKFAK